MKKTILLSIENPCAKKWASLEKTGAGRYCASCDHQVIDFSNWPEDQLLAYLSQAKGKVCGRLQPAQCRAYPQASKKQGRWSGGRLLIAAGLLSLSPTSSLWAQGQAAIEIFPGHPMKNHPSEIIPTENIPATTGTSALTVFTVQGRLMAKGEAGQVAGATVLQVGTNLGTSADGNGCFNLQITGQQHDQVKLAFAFIGYDTVYKVVPLEKEIIELGTIVLTESPALMGEVVIACYGSPSPWQLFLSIFKR